MTILQVVYASAPVDELIIPTLEIQIAGGEAIRVCQGYEDRMLSVDGVYRLFEAAQISLALPEKNATGQQSLTFAISGVNATVQGYVDQALESGEQVLVIYREYLASDVSEPASRPRTMVLAGGEFSGDAVQLEASYYDLLNTAWPRERYTVANAPGLKYMT